METRHDRGTTEIHSQGLHVRPVRHRGGHADRSGRGRHAVPARQGLAGQSQLLRHLVATHAFRELDDRCAAASRPHAVSRDRRTFGRLRDGPCRHQLHDGRGACAGGPHRAAATVSRGSRGTGPAAQRAIGWWCCRTAIPTCWRPRSSTTASRSSARSRLPRPIRSSRMSRPTPRPPRSSACGWTKCCSSPTTRSTASVRRRPACARRSSTAAQRPFGATPHQPDLLVPSMTALADAIA